MRTRGGTRGYQILDACVIIETFYEFMGQMLDEGEEVGNYFLSVVRRDTFICVGIYGLWRTFSAV
jgi:hypothetical protein